ncbi:MAG: FdhF/YdeP family oxidoreductase [Euryarchaeota archaeon]|jgi:molybdopterin-dependent oxidoreductase alpha subunit|nr:FdhF/YdeP family oxidoreductase [Euryarchaeota archaeon]MBT4982119.1 FdhF/YdeP family oxidoreductase [Euryarchaeota archaeon]MBT5184597.1 FdhF/YdeP family oxidoreductase [Euryarchaeota archaeon]
MSGRENARATTPPDRNALKIKKPKSVAAGIPAAKSTMLHGISRMGITKTIKTLTTVNQPDGFDCPGCAWPDPEHSTMFEFCENGAKAVADEATNKRVTPSFFANHSVQNLAEKSDYWLNKQGRLTHPMVLNPGSNNYQEISWNDAFDLIATNIKQSTSPDHSIFYTSGRTSNEAAFLYQLFARTLGTNNMPDCSNMCHESSGRGLGETIGIGKGTVSLEDFNHADVIVVIGQNPGTNHPRMLTALRDAKRLGAKIIHVNPLPETGLVRFKHPQDYMKMSLGSEPLADIHLQIKIGGDAALMHGLMKVQLELDALDHEFIKNSTQGFDSVKEAVISTRWSQIEIDTGLTRFQIETAGRMMAKSNSTIACWAMGLTQHKNGVSVIQEVSNLILMGGHIGKKGAGLCPVRGHSNVQGDRTVGIWERPSEAFLSRLDAACGIESPREHGVDVVEAIQQMRDGGADLFFCMGGNFISATPDTEATAEGLRNVKLTVQVSTKLNRSHLVTGETALILPCLGRTEMDIQESGKQFVTVENSMGIVHTSEGSLRPASTHLRSEVWIVSSLATAALSDTRDWMDLSHNYDQIRDLMSSALAGFEDYNVRVTTPNGFALPNPPRDTRTFDTPDGKAHFIEHALPDVSVPDGNYVMMTIRSHDQYNTTIYDLHDRYRGVHGNRRIVLMNATDMIERGWKSRHIVDIVSHYEGENRRSDGWQLVAYDIPRGNIATYFPEANVLVPLNSTAEKSNTPTSKWIVCSLLEPGQGNFEEE